jgi:hypothetical protein
VVPEVVHSVGVVLYSHCNCLSARLACIDCVVCPHVMQALSDALKTSAHALGICVSSCTGRIARLFFMLETCGPQGAVGYVAAPEPTSAGR